MTIAIKSPVEVSGKGPFRYQWFRNGSPILGANASEYVLTSVQASQHKSQFAVWITNDSGSTLSEIATLGLRLELPEIEAFKGDFLVAKGDPAKLNWKVKGAHHVRVELGKSDKGPETAQFGGGEGSADTKPLQADTTYTLTATNLAGQSNVARATVRIAELKADSPSIPMGGSTQLVALFPEGEGTITPGIGRVFSGVPVTVSPKLTTSYKLTITNGAEACHVWETVNPSGKTSKNLMYGTVTPLPNGKVLIIGQDDANVELYDSKTMTCSPAGAMSKVRFEQTATLLNNGKVLVTGGNSGDGNSAELFDPATGQFTPTGAMSNKVFRYPEAILMANGMVLMTCGYDDGYAEIYDPKTGSFSMTNLFMYQRTHGVSLKNGKVLLVDENDGSSRIYDPETKQDVWTDKHQSRFCKQLILLPNGKVFVSSGDEAEIFDPETGKYTKMANPPQSLRNGTLLPDGKVFFPISYRAPILYDYVTNAFYAVDYPARPYSHKVALLPDGKLLLISDKKVTELFDPSTFKMGKKIEPKPEE